MEKIQIILGDASNYSIATTTDLMAMVKTLAIDKKIPVGLFSTQASNVQVVNRLVCTSVPEIKNERMSKQQWEKASDFLGILQDAPLYLDDTPEPSLSSIKEKIMQLKEEHGVKVFVFDRLPQSCEDNTVLEEIARTYDVVILVGCV